MSELPQDVLTAAEVFEWYKLTDELAKLKQREHFLRMRVFRHLVPLPKEGTNTVELAEQPMFAGIDTLGYVLKATHVISRDIDEGALTVLTPKFIENKISIEKLVNRKPTLAVSEYRKLTKEQTQLFDQALIVKDGSPQVHIVLPKARAEKAT